MGKKLLKVKRNVMFVEGEGSGAGEEQKKGPYLSSHKIVPKSPTLPWCLSFGRGSASP